MDTIILSGVQVYAHGGVTGEEKEIGQRYHVDVEMGVDTSHAGQTDALRTPSAMPTRIGLWWRPSELDATT